MPNWQWSVLVKHKRLHGSKNHQILMIMLTENMMMTTELMIHKWTSRAIRKYWPSWPSSMSKTGDCSTLPQWLMTIFPCNVFFWNKRWSSFNKLIVKESGASLLSFQLASFFLVVRNEFYLFLSHKVNDFAHYGSIQILFGQLYAAMSSSHFVVFVRYISSFSWLS